MTIVVHGPAEQGQFALTFDDGPEPGVTDRVLELLDRHDAKATFFCVGEQVERSPELAREILARGHEVAPHTQRHLDHQQIEGAQAVRDMIEGAETLERLLSIEVRLYRAPYGRFVPATLAESERRGWASVFWSSWGRDWLPDDAATITARVVEHLHPGAIVLLHDSARYAHERDDCTPTIDATELILAEARRRDLVPVTVGRLLA